MTRGQIAHLGRAQKVIAFSAEYPTYFASGKGAALLGVVGSKIPQIRQLAGQQEAATGSAQGATGLKDSYIEAIWEDLVDMTRTFRTLKKYDPQIDVKFELPTRGNEAIIAAARAFAINAAPLESRFIEWGMKADFLADLQADIAAYDAASQSQDTRYGGRQTDTAELSQATELLVDAIDDLDTLMRNVLRAQPLILSKWKEAARYERPTRAHPKPETPPVPKA
ncbi:MAG TPA: hypothetical protein VF627_06885 [Abditibacterium sp.]|jgi:hypothetical protein